MDQEQGQVEQEQPDNIIERLTNYNNQEEAEVPLDGEGNPIEQEEASEEEEKAEEPSITLDPEAPLFETKVKVEGGGEAVEKLSLKQLQEGYMRQADYQRKTAEVARARDTLTQEARQLIEPERQQFISQMNAMQKAMVDLYQSEIAGVDLETLVSDDPAAYVRMQAKAQKLMGTINAAQQAVQEAQRKAVQEQIQTSIRMLNDPVQGIPGWGQEMYQSLLRDGVNTYGFSPDEMAGVTDYRMLKVLKDATEFRKLQAAKPAVEKKVNLVPKVVKPGTQQESPQAQDEKKLRERLKRTGSEKDAQALMLARLTKRG